MPEIIVKLGERVIHRYFFDKDVLSVGRARDNDIVIENLSVSRNHARIKREGDTYHVIDMNSANGTLVNGVRVTKTAISDNDVLTVGKHTLVFLETAPEAEPKEKKAGETERDSPPPPSMTELAAEEFASEPSSGQIGLLVVTKGKQAGQEFPITGPQATIGRANDNDIRIHDWFVSKKHAVIIRQGNSFRLKDLDSWRGTTVDGTSIRETDLSPGQEIVFGTTALTFQTVDGEEYARTHPRKAVDSDSKFDFDKSWEGDPSSATGSPPVTASGAKTTTAPKSEDPPEVEPESDRGIILEEQPPPLDVTEKAEDDEFAPMTDEELEALEREADLHEGTPEEEAEHRRMSWEMLEAEKMFEQGEDAADFSLAEKDEVLRREEEGAIDRHVAIEGLQDRVFPSDLKAQDLEEEQAEEEAALEGESAPEESKKVPVPAGATPEKKKKSAKEKAPAEPPADPALQREVQMWEKALKNKSSVIRRNAAKELKRLTGKDYDWNSEPTGS